MVTEQLLYSGLATNAATQNTATKDCLLNCRISKMLALRSAESQTGLGGLLVFCGHIAAGCLHDLDD